MEHLDFQFSSVNPSAAELQQRIEMLRPIYDKACAKLAGKDPEWETKKQALIVRVSRLVMSFDGKSDASAAFILGQVKALVDELEAPRRIKAEFETYKNRWENMTNTRR